MGYINDLILLAHSAPLFMGIVVLWLVVFLANVVAKVRAERNGLEMPLFDENSQGPGRHVFKMSDPATDPEFSGYVGNIYHHE